jgi:hypothetical protein
VEKPWLLPSGMDCRALPLRDSHCTLTAMECEIGLV